MHDNIVCILTYFNNLKKKNQSHNKKCEWHIPLTDELL